MAATAAAMPAGDAAPHVTAGLDLAPAHRIVAQDGRLLDLLRLLVGLGFACLGRMQSSGRRRGRPGSRRGWRAAFGLLLFAFAPLAFLLLAQLRGLDFG